MAATAVISGAAGAASTTNAGQVTARAAVLGAQSTSSLLTTASSGVETLTVYAATKRRRTPRQIARKMMWHRFHWGRRQFRYVNKLWYRESHWNKYANNPYSGAYGIPQAVPGSKMSTAGPNWQSNAHTQILWGLRYIKGRYGNPHHAWEHEISYGWY